MNQLIKNVFNFISSHRLTYLLSESWKEFNHVNGSHLAASISFNLFFSLFPLVFVALFIGGSMLGTTHINDQIIRGLNYLLPESRQLVQNVVSNIDTTSKEISILAFVGAVWGGISFFNAVRVALNTVWETDKHPSVVRNQFINFIMLLAAGILLTASVLLTIFLSEPSTGTPQPAVLRHNSAANLGANVAVAVVAFLCFILLFKFIPHHRPRWRDIWVGALACAITFELTKLVFIGYVRIFHPYNLVYGSIGIVIAFLMWAYLSAWCFLFIAKAICIDLKIRNAAVLVKSAES